MSALIEAFFGGNRTLAARAWGVPQPTVQRLATGSTATARAASLDRIARYHDTTVDWLLHGRGRNPLEGDPIPMALVRDFESLVDQLGLSPAARRAVLGLPKPASTAYSVLCQWDDPTLPQVAEETRRVARDAMYRASAQQYVSWGAFFDGLIRAYGLERVREKLESEHWRIGLGFQPLALELLWMKEESRVAVFEHLEGVLARQGNTTIGVTLIDAPTIPALNTEPPRPRRGRPGRPKKLGPRKA